MEIDYNQIVNMCLWTEVFLVYEAIKLAKMDYGFSKTNLAIETICSEYSFGKSLRKILFEKI